MNKPKRDPRSRNREATEQLLIDACERILLSHGPDGIGVNNVVQEAGVGKQLLYRYFDGLPGLVSAWLERSAHWPTAQELIGDDADFAALNFRSKVKTIQHNYLDALRQRPVIMRIMASELMHPTAITSVLEKASDKVARDLTLIIKDMSDEQQENLVNLSLVFYCMLNYLCMRAVTSPNCFGMDLEQQKSWDRIGKIVDLLVDSVLDD
ncbi:MAG: TetR/AcrR family transcriptional regulator [Pseudomonadales bacterium]